MSERLDLPLSCQSCKHFRPRKPEDKSPCYAPENAKHWCDKLNIHTWPGALRCAGDDYYPEKGGAKAQELFDAGTPEGFAKAVDWTKHLLSSLKDGGTWGIPRSGAIYTLDRAKQVATVTGEDDPVIRRVIEGCGWKVVAGPLVVKTGDYKTTLRTAWNRMTKLTN